MYMYLSFVKYFSNKASTVFMHFYAFEKCFSINRNWILHIDTVLGINDGMESDVNFATIAENIYLSYWRTSVYEGIKQLKYEIWVL